MLLKNALISLSQITVNTPYEAAGSASKAVGWALQAAGKYYQKHAFENRVNIMILYFTVNSP